MTGIRPRHLDWWYWVITLVLLGIGLSGRRVAFGLAILLAEWQVLHFAWRRHSFRAFPVQVRIAYTLLLVLCLAWPPLFWGPALGTAALVLAGYCPMARFLLLMPWNRVVPLSRDYVGRVFLSPPRPDSILLHPRLQGLVRADTARRHART